MSLSKKQKRIFRQQMKQIHAEKKGEGAVIVCFIITCILKVSRKMYIKIVNGYLKIILFTAPKF